MRCERGINDDIDPSRMMRLLRKTWEIYSIDRWVGSGRNLGELLLLSYFSSRLRLLEMIGHIEKSLPRSI